jgi:hypothetical protein
MRKLKKQIEEFIPTATKKTKCWGVRLCEQWAKSREEENEEIPPPFDTINNKNLVSGCLDLSLK